MFRPVQRAGWVVTLLIIGGSAAAQSQCPGEATFRSLNSNHSTSIVFRNEAGSTRQLHWLDFNGRRVLYATVPPGGDFSVNTYVSHPWVSTDTEGRCVSVFFPDAQPVRITLKQ